MNGFVRREISGWGRFPVAVSDVFRPEKTAALSEILGRYQAVIARGEGRGYGDVAVCSDGATIRFSRLNRFRSFDEETGLLICEAGVSIKEICEIFVPRGWFVSVTPGTQFASVGGCLACDVHGKNHHGDGSFVNSVQAFELLLANGDVVFCSRSEHADLFWATAGGIGLTGIIITVTLRLVRVESAYIRQAVQRSRDLDESLALLADQGKDYQYSVAWLDTMASGVRLGRGVVMLGNWAKPCNLPAKIQKNPFSIPARPRLWIPFDLPSCFLNRVSIRVFNECYFLKGPASMQQDLVNYSSFFYPLDSILSWNRLYGKRGFVQYQFVLPVPEAALGIRQVLSETIAAGCGSFLSVLKILGDHAAGPLSFPMSGVTLAMDFARRPGIEGLLSRLDRIVAIHGGRFYLAKDSRLPREIFQDTQPNLEKWLVVKRRVDPLNRFRSHLSQRLGLS